jgi:hypothetical protein
MVRVRIAVVAGLSIASSTAARADRRSSCSASASRLIVTSEARLFRGWLEH